MCLLGVGVGVGVGQGNSREASTFHPYHQSLWDNKWPWPFLVPLAVNTQPGPLCCGPFHTDVLAEGSGGGGGGVKGAMCFLLSLAVS